MRYAPSYHLLFVILLLLTSTSHGWEQGDHAKPVVGASKLVMVYWDRNKKKGEDEPVIFSFWNDKHNAIDLPGGKHDDGEGDKECLLREVLEEIDFVDHQSVVLKSVVQTLLNSHSYFRGTVNGTPYHINLFAMAVSEGLFRSACDWVLKEPGHTRMGWRTLDEVKKSWCDKPDYWQSLYLAVYNTAN